MNKQDFRYGIFNKNVLVVPPGAPSKPRTARLGQIVKIDSNMGDGAFSFRFLKDPETWESPTFVCKQKDVTEVNEKVWQYLEAVASPQERLKLARNKEECERLSCLAVGSIVGFTEDGGVLLGTLRFMGPVQGIGYCFGIQLHEKKKDNKCDGSCAGVQYFHCLPGFGVFTTADKICIRIQTPALEREAYVKSTRTTELDEYLQKNILSFSSPGTTHDKPKNEKPVTKYGQYDELIKRDSNKSSSYFRTSHSLQNLAADGLSAPVSTNSNNDFDQNTIIQADKQNLVKDTKKNKNKSEVDLADLIIGDWHGASDPKELRRFGNTLQYNYNGCTTNGVSNGISRNVRHDDVKLKVSDHSTKKPSSGSSYLRSINGEADRDVKKSNTSPNGGKKSDYRSSQLGESVITKSTISSRNKSTNILSHFVDGTLPKRNKVMVETAKFYDSNGDSGTLEKKLNEKSERAQQKAAAGAEKPKYRPPDPGTTGDFTVGRLVEVCNDVSDEPFYGVIRWMGVEENATNFTLAGVELEEELLGMPLTLTDGTHNGQRMFRCADHRALFVPLDQLRPDSRFQDGVPTPVHQLAEEPDFQRMTCPVIEGAVAPLCMPTEEDVEAVCGKLRGIQGHHNSCYLDVTLFAMFTYTAVFDSLLFRPKGPKDIVEYDEVQRVLREEIVNPLRKNLYVSADHVMNLRKLLDRLSSVQGLTSEEKDPEEFLNSLLAQILKAEPFLKLNSGQEAFYYQLFVEKDAALTLPTVQQLFEQSFLTSNIKLKEVPSCLIIQMPRFGKNYKMYPRILPSQLLDVTDVIEGSPRQCIVCGKLAWWECRECFDNSNNTGLEGTAFCSTCLETAHRHEKRSLHKPTKLGVNQDYAELEAHCPPPRLYMELFAVICIETSHYVAFVKCGVGHEAPWCFFDSMADRKGEKNGYNIPEMVACPDISRWLSDERICRELHEEFPHDRHLPEHARRLLCDAYICMYQSSDVMMYR